MLLPSTKSAFHRQADMSKLVVCIFGSVIERFYDDEGNETYIVVMTAGCDCPSVVMSKVVITRCRLRLRSVSYLKPTSIYIYHPFKTEDILED